MEKEKSLTKYKSVDLMIWTLMLGVFETLIVKAGSSWFKDQPYILSLVPALSVIIYMRWSLYGVLYAALGGLFTSFAFSAGWEQTAVYVIGNMLSVLVYPFLKAVGKERVRQSFLLSASSAVLTALLMQTGRGLVSLVMGSGLPAMVDFITTDALSGVFAVIITGIVRRRDGVFEDQITYLVRVKREEEEKKNEGHSF